MNAALTPVLSPVTRARFDLRLGIALGLVYAIWGSTYLALGVGVHALPPWGLAGSRYFVAGCLALLIARFRGDIMPSKRDWLLGIPGGILLFVLGNGLIAVAEQSIPSSVAAVVAATSPLIVASISAVRGDRPTKTEGLGMALGLVGVLVLTGSSALLHAGIRGLMLMVAPVGWAVGSMLVRGGGTKATGLAASAPQMVMGGVGMLLISAATREHLPAHVPLTAIAAWAYLVVAGSLIGFTSYAWLLRNARPAVAMSHAYVNPLVAVVLGAWLGSEPLGGGAALAAMLIAGGVMVSVTLGARRRTRTPMDPRIEDPAEKAGSEV